MKIPLKILDYNLNLIAEIDDYENLMFNNKFYSIGDFEFHINKNKKYTEYLLENNFIMLGKNTSKVGVIMHIESNYNNAGEITDTLTIKGYMLKGILSRRLIIPDNTKAYFTAEGSQELIMKEFVNKNCINTLDPARKIKNLILAENKNRGKADKWRARYELLSDKLQEVGEYSNLGWNINLDLNNNSFVFDVVEGRNLTANQEELPPVIFSVAFDNLLNRKYIRSALNYKNVGYIGGHGEEENRLIQKIGTHEGFERIETFIDCGNAEIDTISAEGKQKLNTLKKIESFEADINLHSSFIYEKDYKLGDIITLQDKKLNVTMDAPILEFKEIYDNNGFNVSAIFGTNIPTILDKFKENNKRAVR